MTAVLAELSQLAAGRAWLVGGAVRDRLLGRDTTDLDAAVNGDPRVLAGELGRRLRAHRFELSESFGGWRVVARDRSWQLDLLPLAGGTIESDLAARDLTVNAMAQPVDGGELIDPFGGQADLAARRLRMVSPGAFTSDPLRVVRLARLASQLGFEPERATVRAARDAAPGLPAVAAERVLAELKQILGADSAVAGLAVLERSGATAQILPELSSLHGVDQSRFHHLDVHDHTLAVVAETVALTGDPERLFPGHGDAVAEVLAEPLAEDLTRGQALRFGALLHDIAKPQTRGEIGGRVTFMGHDRDGAVLATEILGRLRVGGRLSAFVAALVRHHLRLGFLVHQMPLSRREVYRYLHACEPVEVDVTLLSVADRLATRGHGSAEAIARHLELARDLIGPALRWRRCRPSPPVRGDALAQALGIRPGPELGRMLAELEEAAYAGEVDGPEQAIALAREQLTRPGGAR